MNYDICVFGGCALDSFYYKNEFGEVPDVPSLIVPGGKGANQAVAASRAGAKVTIITKLGKDDKGQKILENLVYNGIATNNVELVDGLQNDCSNIIIDNVTKDNEIIRFAGAIDSFTPDMIQQYRNVFLHSKIVVGQMKVPKEVSVELINFCHKNDIPIIITPCRPNRLSISEEGNKELIDKITYITANKSECETIFGTDNIEECVTNYPNKLIVTLGDDGIMYHNGTEIVKVPAVFTKNVVDTTGAGDTFNGNFAAFLSRGFNLREAIVKAQYASSMKIQVKGAQDGMPYEDELDKYIVNHLMEDNDYTREFDLAYNAILKANDKIKRKKILNVKVKEDETFVTESDLLIEKMIIDDITDQYPNDNFVTEEFNNKNIIKDRTWIIDPIDGTAHYMKNSIFWGTQLAFVDHGKVQFSIIYIPKLNEIYYGIRGKGVYLNHKKVNIKRNVSFQESAIEFCGSCHKKYEEKKELFERLLSNSTRPANFMHINSCCFAFSNLLSGRSNTLIISTRKPWDVVPGMFMVEELGIKSYDYEGIRIYSNTKDIDKFL
ncbi:MAG: hypothetical protein E7162_03230 [Firmicutes bacterium]|nr:hypothetical protein [Bacillota bacterium]